jgi:hypothetical protein
MTKHCCEDMKRNVEYKNETLGKYDCPDNLITYVSKMDEYGIVIHDGGSSYIKIEFCPWCGAKLPESKRDLWFETLSGMGYKFPAGEDNLPEEFETDEWWKKRGL